MNMHHCINRIVSLIWLSLFISGILIHPGFAESVEKTKTITVIGESQILKDIPGARNSAISDCLLFAVQNAVIDQLPLPLLTEKFQSISSLLSDQRNNFILDYKVLQENKTDKQYRVLVSATVSLDKLQQALTNAGIVSTVEKMPQVLFLIAEQNVGDTDLKYWWQKEKPVEEAVAVASIKEILKSKGFPVIDPQFIPTDFFDNLQLGAALKDAEAIDLGKRLFADVVVVGTAVATEAPNRMGENIRSVKGAINVRVLFTGTGDQLGPIQNSSIAADRDNAAGSRQALSDAGRKTGEQLASQIVSKWEEIQKPTGEITINIKGHNILAHLVEFRNALKNVQGVTNQRTLEIAPDAAVLSVSYQGTSQNLADAVLLQSFKGFGVNIYEITNRNLNIEMISQ
jgi:hypothetical protein